MKYQGSSILEREAKKSEEDKNWSNSPNVTNHNNFEMGPLIQG